MTRPTLVALFAVAVVVSPAGAQQVNVGIYETACDGGEAAACNVLGLMYETGEGVETNPERAAQLFETGCVEGSWVACTNLGRLYLAGTGVEADPDRARDLLETACEAGESLACGLLQTQGWAEAREVQTGELVGRILDAISGDGLSQVMVATGGGAEQAMTGRDGSFVLRAIPAGRQIVEISRFGYESRTAELVVLPGRTVELFAELSAEPVELEAIEVTVRPASLERVGFYARSVEGIGRQLTRKDLSEMNLGRTSEALRNLPSIYTRLTATGTAVFSRRGGGLSGTCQMGLWIDGIQVPGYSLDNLHPNDIEALEIYQGVNTPIQYRHACGVVLIWTR